ncbi:MAG: hypothetical protein RBS05_11360, partial [Zoogloea oleivorans]|uniref:hypothetical protein n=1 Tax=Zoogloea oleivorans TaxID=1552750 RepID=UPI002A3680D8
MSFPSLSAGSKKSAITSRLCISADAAISAFPDHPHPHTTERDAMFFGLGKISKKSRLNKINKEFATQIGRIATQIAKGKRNEE